MAVPDETKARTMRLLQAITDALTGAPDDVFAEVGPRLQEIADEWSLDEITERCSTCWKQWSEWDCFVGESPCTCEEPNRGESVFAPSTETYNRGGER